jgi:ATP-binding cassette subfamily A (ABC1) protein 3
MDSALEAGEGAPVPIEALPGSPMDHIQLRGLRKVYATPTGPTAALTGLDMSFAKGEISVLLGPNGAGKSTTIGILTGMLTPDAGSVAFFERHGLEDMPSPCPDVPRARRSLGLCPQHDVLFEELTVAESLAFYAAAKGIPPEGLEGEVSKAHAVVASLSGGQKRKLSLGIALVGGSEVIILDEPTAGMDPVARTEVGLLAPVAAPHPNPDSDWEVWGLLQRQRAGRVVILTTHFMDEAEALGDRVGIMAEGSLRCQGSPLWLHKTYPQARPPPPPSPPSNH